MDLDLKDKKVFITASSDGIGKATVEVFLKEGASVVINGRDKIKLEKSILELKKKYGENKVHGIIGDMSQKENIENAKSQIEDYFGGLDILVGNLGTGKPISSNKLDVEEWKYMIDKNLLSAVSLIEALIDSLAKNKDSNIVLLASLAAFDKIGAPPAYAAAKRGIVSLIKYSADAYAKKGIRVNGVSPGNIYYSGGRWDELEKEDPIQVHKYIEDNVPMQRFGKPEEIANAIVFLASGKAAFITGTVLQVDGGQSRSY